MKNANPVCRAARAGVLVTALSLTCALAGCAREKRVTASAVAAHETIADYFEVGLGDKFVRMQIAVRPEEMQRGLMERRDLGQNEGMLFVYDHPQQMSFWMRNTPTPLDIGFFDSEGAVKEIYPLHPFDETAVRSRNTELSMALEMNQGWYRENGIKPGAKLDMRALAAALKARGYNFEQFGLAD